MSIDTIDAAILAHRAWVARFQTALKGINGEIFDSTKTGDDRVCELGQWLNSESASQLLGDEAWHRITALHQTFHEIAAGLATSLNFDRTSSENRQLLGACDDISKQLVELLLIAKKRLQTRFIALA